MEDNAPHRPKDSDPGLDELAALEMQVDNWLRPAVKAETVAPGAGPAIEEETAAPEASPPVAELRQRSVPPEQPAGPQVQPAGFPRALKRALLAVLGLGAAGAIGAAMFIKEPEPPVRMPVVQAPPVPLPAKPDPVPLVFLDETETGRAAVAKAPPAQPSADDGKAGAAAPKTAVPRKTVAKEKKTAVVARRAPAARNGRRLSDAERVEAAVAQCRATSTRPGGCNLRVCDVLGSAHPACRE